MATAPRLGGPGNLLLDRLPPDELGLLEPFFRPVEFQLKQVIDRLEGEVTQLYFPTTALASMLTLVENDDPIEAATVGRDGFVNLSAALGDPSSPHQVICQVPGHALRLPLDQFREVQRQSPRLTRMVNQYAAFSLRQSSQLLACNTLHGVEERAARWLLTLADQTGREEFPITHEFLAAMLGVRRQTATVVVGTLRAAGLVRHRRGVIAIRDRNELENAACECYGAIREHYRRLLG
jgi:CRP-like cAMP-binding protein